jgi:hypothetical protein
MLSCADRVQSSVIAALLLIASGCGSTGGNPGGGSGGPWLLYAGAGVFALDASKPSAAAVTVDATSNVGGLRVVPRGTYAAATGTVSAVEAYAGIWISGGRILRSLDRRWQRRRSRARRTSAIPARSTRLRPTCATLRW